MRTRLTIALLLVGCMVTKAQQIQKTFYDFKKTQIKEEYQVNAAGEKNGTYKGYNEKGVVVEEATFKNGQLNGVYKKYTTYAGKREIAQSETYLNGLLDGPATYYGENNLVLKSGNYKSDKKDGKWIMLDKYTNYNIKNPAELKGCEWIKSEVTYANGEPSMNGKVTVYYYPSMKVRSTQEYTNGKKSGEHYWYFPNGKTEAYYKYDENEKYLNKKTYYYNGQVWEDMYWENGQFITEGYYEDGTPDRMTKGRFLSKCNSEMWKKILEKDYAGVIAIGDKALKVDPNYLWVLGNYAHALLLSGKYDDAMKIYKAHMGENLSDQLSWNNAIIGDFKEFQTKGIQSDSFDKVLTELKLK